MKPINFLVTIINISIVICNKNYTQLEVLMSAVGLSKEIDLGETNLFSRVF